MFELLDTEQKGRIPLKSLQALLRTAGLDPELPVIKKELATYLCSEDTISFDGFRDLINGPATIVQRSLTGALAIPNFQHFCEDLVRIFDEVKPDNQGETASYIPELASVDPEKFGFAICTVDGQCFAYGDAHEEFCLQSCSNPFMYCLACEENGISTIHRYVGREPSGGGFSAFSLRSDNKPHNPMINTGAILTDSFVRRDLRYARFFRNSYDVVVS